MAKFAGEIKACIAGFKGKPSDDLDAVSGVLARAVESLERATQWMLANAKSNTDAMAASAQPYQRQLSLVAGGYMMARQALAAHAALLEGQDADFYNAKLIVARYFSEAVLPQVFGLESVIMGGTACAVAISNDQF